MSLAIATHIPFREWELEDDITIVTALQLLDDIHAESE